MKHTIWFPWISLVSSPSLFIQQAIKNDRSTFVFFIYPQGLRTFFSFFHIYSLTFTMLAGLEKDILVQLLVLLNCPLLWTIQSRCWLDVYLAFSVNKLNKYGQCART